LTRETGGAWIPPGATMPSSVPGYASCVLEIARQCGAAWPFDAVVVAYGTGSTSAGLLAGLALAGAATTVHAVSVSSAVAMQRFHAASPRALAQAAVDLYGWPAVLDAGVTRCEWLTPTDEPGYGITTTASEAALRRFAQDEGYLLDPTYTAKAAAALLAMAADGRLAPGQRVLFVHTGGLSTTAAGPSH